MPTYSYECLRCSRITEKFHSMSESPKVSCSHCSASETVRVILQAPAANIGNINPDAVNSKKYWGSKPIVDINLPTNQAGTKGVQIKGDNFRHS
jgi:putative FmdB family regulatory protein